MIKTEIIRTQKELMDHYGFMQGIPVVNMTPETMLANCLLDINWAMSFVEDDKIVGVVILKNISPTEVAVIGIHLVNYSKKFHDLFYSELYEMGIRNLQAISKLPEDRFEGFSGFKKEYTFYRKKLKYSNKEIK